MKLSDIKVRDINQNEIRTKSFNKYAKAYNNLNEIERIRFTADLVSLKDGYERQAKTLNDAIEQRLPSLQKHLNRMNKFEHKTYLVDGKPQKVAGIRKPDEDLENAISFVRSQLFSSIHSLKSSGSDLYLEWLKANYKELLDEVKESYEVPAKHFRLIQGTFDQCIRYFKINTQAQNLSFIIDKIAESNYEGKLNPYEDLSDSEKEEIIIRNEEAQEWVNRGNEINEYFNKKIMREAKGLISKNSKECITKSGNATKYLYETVHRKLKPVKSSHKTINPPSDSTVKNRINEWLKEDKI